MSRLAAVLLVSVVVLSGCQDGDPRPPDPPQASSSPSPASPTLASPTDAAVPLEVNCPYGDFSQVYVPSDWTAGFVEVCHDPGQANVLVVNTSPGFVRVAAAPQGGRVTGQGSTEQSFADLMNAEVAASWTSDQPGVLVPPGGWVTVSGTPASAVVGLQQDVLAVSYAATKLVSYVEGRMTSPGRARAAQVAGCVTEVGKAVVNARDPSLPLDYVVADAALGAGLQCRAVFATTVDDAAVDPPPVGVLQAELGQFRRSIKASAVDDLTRLARNFAQVLR